jgi:hypothetical protein
VLCVLRTDELTVAGANRSISKPGRCRIAAFRLILDREIECPQCGSGPSRNDLLGITCNVTRIDHQ